MSKHIYWKLQSINSQDHLEFNSEEFNIYRDKFKKDYETRQLMSEEETMIHYNYNAWRNPAFSRIFSLTLAFVENNQVRIKYITGEEKDILLTFLNTLKSDYFKEHQITHFGGEIILPYLGVRLDKNGFLNNIPKGLQYKNKKPWNLDGCCVKDYYTGAGNYKYSLKEIAWIYGIKTSYIEPSDEFSYYKQGKLTNLKESAIDEIYTLVNVHRLMTGEDKILDYQLSEEKVAKVVEVEQKDYLKLLYETQKLTKDIRDGIRGQVKKKRLTKKDRELLNEIILSTYLRTDFINKNMDSKFEIERKKIEVEDFLKEL